MTKLKSLWVMAIMLSSLGCEKEEGEQPDNLESLGLLGTWEIKEQSLGGMSSLLPLCCEFITFKVDGDPADLIGEFGSFGASNEHSGTFEVDLHEANITFNVNARIFTYAFQIQGQKLFFAYSEEGVEIMEFWEKQE